MLSVMLGALVAALLTDICTDPANFAGIFTTLCHQRSSQTANLCTLHIQTNALCHHFDIIFLQASNCAGITVAGTYVASFYTGFVFSEIHLDPLAALLSHVNGKGMFTALKTPSKV
jgi:hypothetical protein